MAKKPEPASLKNKGKKVVEEEEEIEEEIEEEEEEAPSTKKAGKAVATTKKAAAPAPVKGKAVVKSLLQKQKELAGRGMETMKQEDLALPFIKVLQSLSPEVQKGNEKFIKGAEAGDLYNTVTKDLWGGEDGIRIIPCYFEKVYNVWTNRDDGGGFGGSYKTRDEADEHCDPETQQVTDTANHYILIEGDDNEWTEAVLSMTSSKLGESRRWNSMMKQQKIDDGQGNKFTPPSFSRVYSLTTVGTQNEKGFYHVPKIEPDDWVDENDIFDQADNFYRMFAEMGVQLNYKHAGEEVIEEEIDIDEDEEGREY